MAMATIARTLPCPSFFFDSLKAMKPKIKPMIAVTPQKPRTPKIKETLTGFVFFAVGAPELRLVAGCGGVFARGGGWGVAGLTGVVGAGGVSAMGGGGGGV